MVLPLPANGFEYYMWRDGRPRHPMSFFIRLGCSGTFDREAFQAALMDAIRRHPLLRSRWEVGKGRCRWVASPDPTSFCDIDGEDAPMLLPGSEEIDLQNENGLRVWVRIAAERTCICLQFHHACCDGVGANQFIEDLLISYDHRARAREGVPPLRPLDEKRLRLRARFGLSWWKRLLRILIDTWGVVVGCIMFFVPRPLPVASPEEPSLGESDLMVVPVPLSVRLPPANLSRLLAAARQRRVTLYELLLRDLFLTFRDWNEHYAPGLHRRMLRIMVPMDLRVADDVRTPAANIVGMVNIDRYLHWRIYRNPDVLLRSIKLELRYLRLFRFGITFVRVTQLLNIVGRIIPRIQNLFYEMERCIVTAGLSNSGRVFGNTPLTQPDGKMAAGDLVVESVEGAPPHRAHSGLCYSIYTYAGELSITMNYDRRRFTGEDARELLQRYEERVLSTIGQDAGEAVAPEATAVRPLERHSPGGCA